MMVVLKSEVVGIKVVLGEEGKEGRKRKRRGWPVVDGNGVPLAFPGRFCRWSRDEPSNVLCIQSTGVVLYMYMQYHRV